MNFVKSSKRRPQFEILEAKQLFAADVLTSGAGGSETANLTAIHAEELLSTGAPVRPGLNRLEHGPGLHDSVHCLTGITPSTVRPGLNRLEHGPGLHDSVHCLTGITLSTGRSSSNPTPHPMPVPELVDACHKDRLNPEPITMRMVTGKAASNPTPHPMPVPELVDACHKDSLDPESITMRMADGRAGSNRLEHGPGLHD